MSKLGDILIRLAIGGALSLGAMAIVAHLWLGIDLAEFISSLAGGL